MKKRPRKDVDIHNGFGEWVIQIVFTAFCDYNELKCGFFFVYFRAAIWTPKRPNSKNNLQRMH